MTTTTTLYVALELGQDKWLLGFATEAAEKPRIRSMPAHSLAKLQEEIAKAKARFGLPAEAPVCTCYEAGRVDGPRRPGRSGKDACWGLTVNFIDGGGG